MNLIDRDKLIEKAEEIIDIGNDFYSESKDKKDAFEHGVKTLKHTIKDEPTVNEWIPVERELPEEETQYLCAIQSFVGSDIYYAVRHYAKDLFKVDNYDFNHKQGVSGFYEYDSEYGYVSTSAVIAWKPIEPYTGDKE